MKQRHFQDHEETGSIDLVRANQQMTMAKIKISKERLAEFCRNNGIQKLSLFGSVLSDDFGPDSDVDVLYVPRDGLR